MQRLTLIAWLAFGLMAAAAAGAPPAAQPADKPAEAAPVSKPASKPADVSPEQLALQQQRLADRYRQLEEVLLRMAELTASSDPRRAALLKKAVAQSKEQLIGLQFDQTTKLLEKDQLSRAIETQAQLERDLNALLDLLMSENRAKRIESEKARIAAYLKRLNQLIADQKSLQGRSQAPADPKSLSAEQQKLADKTHGLAKDVRADEEPTKPAADKPSDKAPPKPSGKDAPKPSGKDAPKPSGKDAPKPSEQSPAKKPAQEAEKPGGSPHPARDRLETGEKRMREAQRKLAEARSKEAIDKQEEAIRDLQQAKAALEEILRQLREEEKGRSLVMLEARFQRMLQLQREVLDGTLRLDHVPARDRTHTHEIESGRLSTKEMEIVVEADKALLLLREDGTAVALPEALGQARQDMQQVVQRLGAYKVDKITQGIEEDVVAALQEMLDAVKREIKKQEDKKKAKRGLGGQSQDDALVDSLAELRMIRALQLRVNNRTERYRKMIDGEQADSAELLEAIRRLSESQQRIFRTTRDLETGKNK